MLFSRTYSFCKLYIIEDSHIRQLATKLIFLKINVVERKVCLRLVSLRAVICIYVTIKMSD